MKHLWLILLLLVPLGCGGKDTKPAGDGATSQTAPANEKTETITIAVTGMS